jgi:DNA-binding LacI/PurR family transcriptional regulator
MNEIAKKLNVSVATVSRVLSGSFDGVSTETRRQITEAAELCGYQRRKKVGRTIVFIIEKELFNLSSLFYTSIISSAEKIITAHKYFFQFRVTEKNETAFDEVNLKFRDLAGTILTGIFDRDFANRLQAMHIPMVLVDYSVPTEDIDTILVDNLDGIMRSGKHLAELGHKRVCYLSSGLIADSITSRERRFGFLRAQESYGFQQVEGLIGECPESISGGFEAINRILDRFPSDPPTAVIAYNDMVAIGAMDAIKRRGLSIPHDISIVGFDDISLSSEVLPQLTTVRVEKELMGTLAGETLFQRIAGKTHLVRKILLPTSIIVRASTAPPKHQ